MITLEKGEEPEVLTRNALHWTNVVMNKLNAGETPTKTEKGRYNHVDVKQALIAETHGKCAYCESKPVGCRNSLLESPFSSTYMRFPGPCGM